MSKDTTLSSAEELLRVARESGLSPSQLKKHIELAGQKGLSGSQFTDFLQHPAYPAVLEAAKLGTLKSADITVLRHVLGLPPKAETEVSNLIVCTVKVNRGRSRQEALNATGRTQYTDRTVVDAMPKGEGGEAEVVFFKPDFSQRNGFISDDDLEKEFELRGLKPADPYTLAAVNEADPAFADEKPHGTHWKDAKGNWCCAAFDRWDGKRGVSVRRDDNGWNDFWWFAGVRK